MGPTPTRTLGMHLSCNFVNVHTIVISCTVHVHVYTRASPMDILARKSARRTKVRGLCRRAERSACVIKIKYSLSSPYEKMLTSSKLAILCRRSISVHLLTPTAAARAAAGRPTRVPDTSTSARGSSRGSQRGSPCRCPCRYRGI